MQVLRLIKADFMKLKHTPFYWIHIFVPISVVTAFLLYYSYSKINSISKLNGFFEAISIAFPLIIGVICALVIEQEKKAGKFKEMISTENSRGICLFSKLMVMIIWGAISLIITVSGFYIGFQYFLKQNVFSINLYINIAVVVFIAQISLYLFHVFLSIRFGSGVSIGMGIFESMISGLFITGLGDGIWRYVPCSFAVRFSDGFFVKEAGTADVFNALGNKEYWIEQCATGFINCIIITLVAAITLKVWFDYFEFSNCE